MKKKDNISPDQICNIYARKRVKLRCKLMTEDKDYVLIEGTKDALEFLGNLLLACANFTDCGFSISPKEAGRIFFSSDSDKGIYIHRVSCKKCHNDVDDD